MLIKKDIADVIEQHPLFAGLERRHLEFIAACATNVRFDEGAYLFHEGDRADTFYVLRHGAVAVEIFTPERDPVPVQVVGEGDVLSWSWLIPPYQAQFDARCITLTRAIAFDGTCLRTKCEQDHDLGYELMKRFARVMIERVRATRIQLLDVYGHGRNS
jgi:CRP-like cAMP-binding protein